MNELQELLDAWRAGTITNAGRDRLERLLDDPQMRRRAVTECIDEVTFTAVIKEQQVAPASSFVAAAVASPERSDWSAFVEWLAALLRGRGRLIAYAAYAIAIIVMLQEVARGPAQSPTVLRQPGVFVQSHSLRNSFRNQPALMAGDVVRTSAATGATLTYRDGTQVTLAPESEIRIDSGRGKQLYLAKGAAQVSAAKQPPTSPMILATKEARLTVVGTHFLLSEAPGATWLAVDEGRVELRSTGSYSKPCLVAARQLAVAGPGGVSVPQPFTGTMESARRMELPVDWSEAFIKGDGEWQVEGGVLKQSKVTTHPVSPALWSTPKDPTSSMEIVGEIPGSMLMETTVTVHEVPGPTAPPDGKWAGFACRVGIADQLLKLYFLDDGGTGKFLFSLAHTEPSGLGTELAKADTMPFAPGSYRVKMYVQRLDDTRAEVHGKLWRAEEAEPAEWTVSIEMPFRESIQRFAVETTHCSCEFRDFKVQVMR